MFSFLADTWQWVVGIVIALVGVYFGGKKVGKSEEKVNSAEKDAQRSADAAKKQSETTEIVKDVQTTNTSLDDESARDKLRNSKYNQPD